MMLRILPHSAAPTICRGQFKSTAFRLAVRSLRPVVVPLSHRSRYATTAAHAGDAPTDLAYTRNIGIIAHIDAGKTTTTERMLFYSGFSRRIGNVDEGSTVMDYLPAERARGITITSACITFPWHTHTVNLIDTPGHADFTFEVERAIRVLDGAVTILDGVAGVEAQTEKVWRQAERYNIPRIIFVNKLDRMGAGFGRTVKEIGVKLNGWPAVMQIPMYETDEASDEVFKGVVDVVENRVFRWGESGGDGRNVEVYDFNWLKEKMPKLHEEALRARVALVELLSEFDDHLVEMYLELGDHQFIPATEIKKVLRRLTLNGRGRVIPVFCGASFRNIGVQPLLDGVVDYLPSPQDRPPAAVSYYEGKETALLDISDDRICALAFKVIHDPKRGMMVFVRVYSGVLTRASHLLNTNLQTKERAQRLLRMYADDAVDIPSIQTGHIGVILGLKHTRTGDTLISEPTVPKHSPQHQHNKKLLLSALNKEGTLQLRPITVPPPVFFASLEPNTLGEQKHLEEVLQILLREDPSLHVSVDPDSGQTLLSGMGELHLEIARDRLVNDLKAKADMGKINIGYRETVTGPLGPVVRKVYDREIAGRRSAAAISAAVGSVGDFNEDYNAAESAYNEIIALDSGNVLTVTVLQRMLPPGPAEERLLRNLSPQPCAPGNEDLHLPQHLQSYATTLRPALLSGALAALSRGPFLGFPLHSTHVHLTLNPNTDIFSASESTSSAMTSATRLTITTALRSAFGGTNNIEGGNRGDGKVQLMEPVMNVAISVPENDLGTVVSDISGARGGNVYALDDDVDDSLDNDHHAHSPRAVAHAGTSPHPTHPHHSSGVSKVKEETLVIDPARIYVPLDARGLTHKSAAQHEFRPRTIRARVPLKEMIGYLRHLRSLTKGRGSFVMAVDRFERMDKGRERGVLLEIRGDGSKAIGR
ncbi:P-loop containing nucleoside triphosphate hydrolase protein [Terfezia boudieri ATCC MYA-4762]|uniref:Ribosome-releasing factor 2, mitochondrial n=1 Tax=Terfezia boudieri ATCC MYA-4762 TaxID=1051890 RepID=A0A3N4L671_9PEZI|nr:P-loop containing nucleoside triphosphate hydrolase protein [Terfezia boudieri ATCC MYA-4762]